ncbi:acyltransferase family protein [Sporolactobacillus kofuensis]|uniref:Acyltransferase family protein n=1 Tax=Sporolactobacillus kofuensis TaxID=269672 RepID=A0ABW1WJG8_9BACL|nr:acyltransferase family protein [Sporolactobacillus kofuensis]MCO7176547.1 acetyltransferase [Sporolactobacillus kofuensis]
MESKHRYMGGLDGLRGLSVLAVIAYHMNLSWAKGGFLGVGIFFVLSGYLITDLLIQEWEQTSTINLKTFWIRRAKRLFPAVLCLLLILFGCLFLFYPSLVHSTRMDAIAALFYYSNWWSIFHHQSYFENFAHPALLKHFWSLAVEEQFYLLWPLCVILTLRLFRSIKWLYVLTLIFSGCSIILMGFLYQPEMDPSRVYFGTDTRAFALLFGAALACIWPSQHLSQADSKPIRRFLDSIGLLAFVLILYSIYTVNEYEDFLYQGGMALFSIITVILISVLAHPSTFLGKWMGVAPLRWIGVRSYGMYLWHYPILLLTTPASEASDVHPLRIVMQFILILTVSSLSLRFIENPIRRSGKHFEKLNDFHLLKKVSFGFGCVFLIFAGLAAYPQIEKHRSVKTLTAHDQTNHISRNSDHKNTEGRKTTSDHLKGAVVTDSPNNKDKRSTPQERIQNEQKSKQANEKKKKAHSASVPVQKLNLQVTAIGDSVMLDAKPYLMQSLTNLEIDSKVGRQFREAFGRISQFKEEGKLGANVLIELGTNGPFDDSQINNLIDLIGPNRQIIFVNTRVPRPWESIVNQTIQRAATTHHNVTMIDWYQASKGHDDYFSTDGVHLTITGAKKYASLVIDSLAQSKK